jgi:hypothetical protein
MQVDGMIFLKSNNIDNSCLWYGKLGFVVDTDEVDGTDTRRLRMRHRHAKSLLINFLLESQPEISRNFISGVSADPLMQEMTNLSIVFDRFEDLYEEILRISSAGIIPFKDIFEPYGRWVYFRDPTGNIIGLASQSIF